jgi:class 3 adenylate cyclase
MGGCRSCGYENTEGAKFCSECGLPLVAFAPAARAERKVLTVLFADLVGFTGPAERLDPEDVQAVLAPYHERLRYELERRGGTVEKFIGDAVMALFGAPVTREDDPLTFALPRISSRAWASSRTKRSSGCVPPSSSSTRGVAPKPTSSCGMRSPSIALLARRATCGKARRCLLRRRKEKRISKKFLTPLCVAATLGCNV